MKIYLAGKIEHKRKSCGTVGDEELYGSAYDDWRFEIVEGLGEITSEKFSNFCKYPVLKNAILGQHDYTGAYFSTHHGVDPFVDPAKHQDQGSNMAGAFSRIYHRDIEAIHDSDIVFAYLESFDCYGTIFELGYAAAIGKIIGIGYASPAMIPREEFWFVEQSGSVTLPEYESWSARGQLMQFLDRRGLYDASLDTGAQDNAGQKKFAGYETYDDYLSSPHWQEMRKKALEHAGNQCMLNADHSKLNLHVHHNSYERLGAEELSDLIVLCGSCHKTFHGK